jgi:hypothetical protein
VDTESEDHLYDALTYGLTNIRFVGGSIGGVNKERIGGRTYHDPTKSLTLSAFSNAQKKERRDWRLL